MILNIVLAILGLCSLVATLVLWCISLYDLFTSKNESIKNTRILWVLVILFAFPLGSVVYFFVVHKKREAIMSIVASIALPLILVLFAIATFVQSRDLDSTVNVGGTEYPLVKDGVCSALGDVDCPMRAQ